MTTKQRDYLILAALCFLCFFWRLGAISLFDGNEGLYVEAAREMYVRADYVTPRSNGLFFFDKPPLALWLDVASFRVLGVNEFAARLPVAVSATLLVFLTYLFAARFLGRRAGLLAGAMVALNPLFFGTARQMTMDIHQSLWFAAAMFCFFLGYQAPPGLGKWWYYGMWASCGLSFMAKSVPGLFPLFLAFLFVAADQRFQPRAILRRVLEAKLPLGLLILIAIIAPWHYLAYLANGHVFYDQYWALHHVKLLKGTDFNHVQPVYYYVPALLIGFLPWSFFLPFALRDAWLRVRSGYSRRVSEASERERALLLLLVWALGLFLIFTAMRSKLVSYLLPMYPAAALLTGDWMARAVEARSSRGLRWGSLALAALAVAGLVGGLAALRSLSSSSPSGYAGEFPLAAAVWIVHLLVVGAVVTTAAALLAWRGRNRLAVSMEMVGMALVLGVAVTEGLTALERYMNAPLHQLTRIAGERAAVGDRVAIYIGRPAKPSLFFYLPDRMFAGPQAPGREAETVLSTNDKEPIASFLAGSRPAYVITDSTRFADLLKSDPELSIAEQRGKWVLVRAGGPTGTASTSTKLPLRGL